MIVCRRPVLLYDVDLIGLAAVVVLAAATAWVLLVPWQHTWNDYRAHAASRAATQLELERSMHQLEQFELGLAQYQDLVSAQMQRIPAADEIAQLLQQVAEVAGGSDLDLVSVTPQPAARKGPYVVSDVQIGGRGRSQDFIRFLDRMAETNPYQTLRNCSISHGPDLTSSTCDLSWTLRLYLLPKKTQRAAGGGG